MSTPDAAINTEADEVAAADAVNEADAADEAADLPDMTWYWLNMSADDYATHIPEPTDVGRIVEYSEMLATSRLLDRLANAMALDSTLITDRLRLVILMTVLRYNGYNCGIYSHVPKLTIGRQLRQFESANAAVAKWPTTITKIYRASFDYNFVKTPQFDLSRIGSRGVKGTLPPLHIQLFAIYANEFPRMVVVVRDKKTREAIREFVDEKVSRQMAANTAAINENSMSATVDVVSFTLGDIFERVKDIKNKCDFAVMIADGEYEIARGTFRECHLATIAALSRKK